MRRALTLLLLLYTAPANADDAQECYSAYTHTNICERAREIQKHAAPHLPMKMNSEFTLAAIIAVGPLLVSTVIWNFRKEKIVERLEQDGSSLAKFSETMDRTTKNYVCGDDVMRAFVGLRGKVQYIYKTLDGFVISSPVVASCGVMR